ncbi:hypothetical protein BI364_13140 [Acidihalobacter yilgarnensis]|uniref:AI-2E family transporter n=1 Tax=Acidihalobacter yilgarnensis TaxID=2819280 RepID=A0A1D8IQX4_9GAMM|nr:AI-2E family transporter [Acidihalobacter yilgarnensis]AOU98783.1 hypothetical protein BI364_13140 [Acidihalobacter yilgarnensis]
MTSLRTFATLGSLFILGLTFYLIEGVLVPFVLAWVLAYLLVPLVDRLQAHMPRLFAIVLAFFMVFVGIAVLLLGLIPALQGQISRFLATLPAYAHHLNITLDALATHLHLPITPGSIANNLEQQVRHLGTHLLEAPTALLNTATGMIRVAVLIALVPIVSFYLLRDWHHLSAGIESFLSVPARTSLKAFLQSSDRVLRRFIHGQLLVMLAIGCGYSLGFGLAGINLGLVLGVLAGLVSVVPFASFILGGLPALLLAVLQFHDLTHPLIILATIGLTEFVGNTILTPVLVGRFVQVHPAVVLLSIFAGGALYGILGMLLALPVAASVSAYWGRGGPIADETLERVVTEP